MTALEKLEPTEAQVLQSIIEYLERRKVFFWRQNVGAYKTEKGRFIRYGTPGAPDICVIKDGFIGLEVKRPSGLQSADQKAFEKALVAAGARYYVVRSIDDVQAIGL